MTLIERYIFRRALISSVGSLVSLALIVWIVQALSRIDIVKTSASAAGNILWIALMLLPELAAGMVPFAILIGAIQTLNRLNADSERTVIAASGASTKLVLRPILLLGFLGGFVMLIVANGVGPLASQAFHNGLRSVNVDTITAFLTPGRFERLSSGLVVSVGESEGGVIKSLFIEDTRDPALELTYFAKEAAVVQSNGQSVLMLYDGQLHRKVVSSGAVSIIEFQTYAFDLSELKPVDDGDWVRTSELSTLALIDPPEAGTARQLPLSKFTEELAERFTSWLYCLVFALWAVAVAGQPQTNRQASNAAMTIGLAGAIGLKAIGFIVQSSIGAMPSLWPVAFAVPLSAALFDVVLIRRGTNVTQLSVVQKTGQAVSGLVARFQRSPRASAPSRAGGRS